MDLELRNKIDDLISVIEPDHETIYRLHYNLRYDEGVPIFLEMRDLDIIVDNRRWMYIYNKVDKDGDPIVEETDEEEEDIENLDNPRPPKPLDWVKQDNSWLPDGPEFTLDQKGINALIESGEMMVDAKTRQRLLAEAADAEMRHLLSQSNPDY